MAVHDLTSCSLTFGSDIIIPGGDGEFFAVDVPEEFTVTDDNSGERIRSMNPGRFNMGATVTVYPEGAGCGILGAIYEAQKGQTIRTSQGSFPGLPLSWVDPNTGTTFRAKSAAVRKAAGIAAGKDAATVTWELDLAGVTRVYSATVPRTPVL